MAPLATVLLQHRLYEIYECGSISTPFFPRSTFCWMRMSRVGCHAFGRNQIEMALPFPKKSLIQPGWTG